MLALLLTFLAPAPPDRPPESPAGVWVVDGEHWRGYTVELLPSGAYLAYRRESDTGDYWAGAWEVDRGGRLLIRERHCTTHWRWNAFGPFQEADTGGLVRSEFDGLSVRGGRPPAGRLTMRRSE